MSTPLKNEPYIWEQTRVGDLEVQFARRWENSLREEIRHHSFARVDLAQACRWALWELEFGDPERAKEELRKVAHLSRQDWRPERSDT